MSNIQTRPIVERDIPALKNLIATNQLFPPDMLDDMSTAYFNGNPNNEIWLTVEGKTLAGILFCKPEYLTEGTANLLLLAVDPAIHRTGVGTVMLSGLENKLRQNSFHLLLVETSTLSTFEPARLFYKRHGFSEVAIIKDFYARGEGKVIFCKYLME